MDFGLLLWINTEHARTVYDLPRAVADCIRRFDYYCTVHVYVEKNKKRRSFPLKPKDIALDKVNYMNCTHALNAFEIVKHLQKQA